MYPVRCTDIATLDEYSGRTYTTNFGLKIDSIYNLTTYKRQKVCRLRHFYR